MHKSEHFELLKQYVIRTQMNNMKEKKPKEVVQTFRLTANEQKMLRYSALSQRMSIGEYIRKSLPLNTPKNEK